MMAFCRMRIEDPTRWESEGCGRTVVGSWARFMIQSDRSTCAADGLCLGSTCSIALQRFTAEGVTNPQLPITK